ncbi:MarR family transcriptional regulator [Propionimicrobium sp. PCR01-08-3]|uniref:MarR family winged helix-turn-helix transcriptional regulator n=1 Tax=Propionimicrobium sp. PCR01-08-3 TaxID=3052086 RepID=UPI00255CFAD2|nr:MarR family transcriptional regulator [Propionimicrobium sp. PCR01-08-3]WIY83016.1 MarR family transcriptional regulator [Propionimicrobium sp. PCR01-08-3]
MDEVDELVAAWQRERPDLDVEPMQIWSRITRLAQLQNRVRAESFAAHSLQAWEFDVLAALRRSGRPYQLTPGQLLDKTHVTSGTMTNRVDRLYARGLVNRTANPHDGRGVLVQLTDDGREKVDAALADLVSAEARILADLDSRNQDDLALALRSLLLAAQQ